MIFFEKSVYERSVVQDLFRSVHSFQSFFIPELKVFSQSSSLFSGSPKASAGFTWWPTVAKSPSELGLSGKDGKNGG